MDIQTKKYHLIEWITQIRDSQLLDKLMRLAAENDWWEEISQAERDAIEEGLTDLSSGKFHDHSEVKNLYERYH
jgi:predicted transcriptional regulator